MIIPAFQNGEVVSKLGVEKQFKPIDTDTLEYCFRHSLTLTSDWKHPNKEDQKQLDKIRLIHNEVKNKDGTITKSRYCPKCWTNVSYTKNP